MLHPGSGNVADRSRPTTVEPRQRCASGGHDGAICNRPGAASSKSRRHHDRWRRSGLRFALLHRYYDPSTGQFMSVDPFDPITGQPYEYTGDNPINASDPSGLDCRNTDTCPPWTSYAQTEGGSNPTPSPSSYGTPGPTGACSCGLPPTSYSPPSAETQTATLNYTCGGGSSCGPSPMDKHSVPPKTIWHAAAVGTLVLFKQYRRSIRVTPP